MSVTFSIDDINYLTQYIDPDAPVEAKRILMQNMPPIQVVTRSMQYTLMDFGGTQHSVLIDNMRSSLPKMVVDGVSCDITLHDAVKIFEFWETVIQRMK